MKKKIVTLCLAVALLAVAVIGTTLAYFTDKEVAKNTFTIGDVDILLDESAVERDETTGNYVVSSANRVAANEYTDIFPGQTLAKDPTVTNVGPYDAYVRVDFVVSSSALTAFHCDVANGNYDAFKTIFSGGILDETFEASTKDANGIANGLANEDYLLTFAAEGDSDIKFSVYTLNKMAKDDAFTVFEEINVPTEMDNEDYALIREGFDIDITATAIQADGFEDAKSAFAAMSTVEIKEATAEDATAGN